MKKRVAIIGATGMLGSMLYNIFKDRYDLVLIYRDEGKVRRLYKIYGKVNCREIKFDFMSLYNNYLKKDSKNKDNLTLFIKKIGKIDAIINCVGIISPHVLKSQTETLFINGALPHMLSSIYGNRLIHITTDCVFNGVHGAPYDENSLKDPTDLYGLSKSLGEPIDKSFVIRTSIIGPEISSFYSLLEWFKRQKETATVYGYTNHLWNGLTTKQLAFSIAEIIDKRASFPNNGLFHVFSSSLSKERLLKKIKVKYDLKTKIKPKKAEKIDRRLTSNYNVCRRLKIPTIDKMLLDL